MSLLNDDELNSLLEQAKSQPLQPSAELAVRAMHAYQANAVRPLHWRRRLLRPVSIPWPVALLTAILLIVVGALAGRNFEKLSTQQSSTYSTGILTFQEFRPVSQIRPHVMRSFRDEK